MTIYKLNNKCLKFDNLLNIKISQIVIVKASNGVYFKLHGTMFK